jgi:LytR cell envelope-related transcriptional attenuator
VTKPAAPPPRRRAVRGSFWRSFLGSAGRGSALIGVAVLIGIVLLQFTDEGSDGGTSAPAPRAPLSPGSSSTTTTASGPRPPSAVRVAVLNASGRANQAGPLSERLAAVGYQTLPPGNASRAGPSVVYFRPGYEAEARAVAAATGLSPAVRPLQSAGPLPEVEGADCVVVIGTG